MALTGERLRRLLHASALRRKQKRRSNRHTSVTTGEEEDLEDDEEEGGEGKEKKSQINGSTDAQYIDCYVVAGGGRLGKERWIKPYGQELNNGRNTTPADPQPTTYTAWVTEDLAFKRLQRQDLPVCVRGPRSPSLSVYVLDNDLTEWIKCKSLREHVKTVSKRADEVLVPRRRRNDMNYGYRGMDSAPPVPPKPDNLPHQPPTLIYRKSKETKDTYPATDEDDESEKASDLISRTVGRNHEPSLPLPPRKNRPRPAIPVPVEEASFLSAKPRPEASKLLEAGVSSEPTVNARSVTSEDDDDENHYEAMETQQTVSSPVVQVSAPEPCTSNKDSLETRSLEDTQESDSMFDKSNDISGDGSYSDLDNLPSANDLTPSRRPKGENSDITPLANSVSLVSSPLNDRVVRASTLPEKSEVVLPRLLKGHAGDSTDSDSCETDTYEAIDTGNKRWAKDGRIYDTVAEDTPGDSGWLIIHKDDIVIVENCEICCLPEPSEKTTDERASQRPLDKDEKPSPDSPTDSLITFIDTSLAYDKDGNAIYIPSHKMKLYGDPSDEPWFYPLELSAREATLFLRGEQQEGCFLVYKSPLGFSSAAYNLSISRGNGDVLHYHIMEGSEGGFMIEGHDHSFLKLADLVEYFKRNKSTLGTRLRRSLKEARLPITAGYHYDLAYELDRDRLSLTGSIIGKGNFGVVCSGMYGAMQVAVKVLQGTEISLEDKDDFIEEAKVLMQLNHENIVRIIGVSSSKKPFFLVTEFVQHGSLKECLRSGRIPTNNPTVLEDICLQMLSALSYLDRLKYMLHRDVAARNFLVAELRSIKLADFGRARFVIDDNYQAPRTEKISIKWAAPEVLIDFRYSTKSDVWAIGVAMWEVFSVGERPYESLSAEQTAVYVTEGGRLPRPSLCPEETYGVVRKCWRRAASSRPSAAALHQAILENREAAISRRLQKKIEAVKNAKSSATVPRPTTLKPPVTPTLRKKIFDNDTGSGKQRFSALRDVFVTNSSSFRESQSPKKSGSQERLPTSSSSENVSLPSTPDSRTTQKIRSSFRKMFITKKMRNNSKSKADYLETQEKSITITDL